MKLNSALTGIIAIGAVGIVVSILNLIGNGRPEVMVGIMISGSIIFGAGVIAAAIAQNR